MRKRGKSKCRKKRRKEEPQPENEAQRTSQCREIRHGCGDGERENQEIRKNAANIHNEQES